MNRLIQFAFVMMTLLAVAVPAAAFEESTASETIVNVIIDPATVLLDYPNARFRLLVHGKTKQGRLVDLTRTATFESKSPAVASVSPNGVIQGLADGKGILDVVVAGKTIHVPVLVKNSSIARSFNFENDIIPVFSKFGCNASSCHGKAEGQNGFKLSIFGFDPRADLAALTQEGRGRRVFPVVPDRSLLLLKSSGGMPHGGGVRIPKGSGEYRTLHGWIAAGMPYGNDSDPHVVSINVTPKERRMTMKAQQQLRVVATYSDGRKVDVTSHAKFQSNNDTLGKVDEFGLVTAGENPGEVAIMANYTGAVDVFRALIPRAELTKNYPQLPVNNFIDRLVDNKLKKLNITPSEMCNDADFLRRVYLDIIGTLPSSDEARVFLADKRSNRRALLVESLLKRPEFADYWSLKWADLLRVDRLSLGYKGAYSYYSWIRDSFAANKPYDQFVRELLTAEGMLNKTPSGHLYKVIKSPGDIANVTSQVLLGIRIECARCHHHPFDRWGQKDYFGMEAFFTQVSFKATPNGELLGALKDRASKHPRTGQVIYAHPLATEMPDESPDGDRRRHLADWMTSPKNLWFAKNFVNRIWASFLGRGLIEPVDDIRLTNPPTNPELLDALAKDFVSRNFNFHDLIRTITSSRTYQLSSKPNETNERDEQNYSRALFKRLGAEVLFDAICQTTGVQEKFDGLPDGSRAIQLWDSQVKHYFLKLFGRPMRATACECERTVEPTVSQVLHVLNSPGIHAKLTHEGGRIAEMTQTFPKDDRQLAEELYLTFYSRYPSAEELKVSVEYLQTGPDRRRAAEDLAWSMMNTLEFLFNH